MTGREPPQARPAKRRRTSSIGLALAGGGPFGRHLRSRDAAGAFRFDRASRLRRARCVRRRVVRQLRRRGTRQRHLAGADVPAVHRRWRRRSAAVPSCSCGPRCGEFRRRLTALPALAARASLAVPARSAARRHDGVVRDARARDAHRAFRQSRDRRLPHALFAAPGRTNDFRKLASQLFIVATNLDTGEPVAFGTRGHDARADLARDRGVERASRPVPAGRDPRRALRRRRAEQDTARVARAR